VEEPAVLGLVFPVPLDLSGELLVLGQRRDPFVLPAPLRLARGGDAQE
jgi:hypothetical protein